MQIASGDGPKGIPEAPLSLTCNMMCTTRGQGTAVVHLFCDRGATLGLIGPKLGAAHQNPSKFDKKIAQKIDVEKVTE